MFFLAATERPSLHVAAAECLSGQSPRLLHALSIFLRNAARFVWGTALEPSPTLGAKPIEMLPEVFIMPHALWILGISLLMMRALNCSDGPRRGLTGTTKPHCSRVDG